MKNTVFRYAVIPLFCLALIGCSRSGDSEGTKKAESETTRQAKEAIQDYGAKPIGKARAAQQAGQDRTDAIDQAVQQKE